MRENLEKLEKFARENYIPVLLDDTRELLIDTVSSLQPAKILEIGTAIGYSGTLMLLSTDANLTTIELSEDSIKIAEIMAMAEYLQNHPEVLKINSEPLFIDNKDSQ